MQSNDDDNNSESTQQSTGDGFADSDAEDAAAVQPALSSSPHTPPSLHDEEGGGVAPPHQTISQCFMCRFNHLPNVRTLHAYMAENVGGVPPAIMSLEMSTKLKLLYPDIEEESISPAMCLKHLKCHSLTPVIRIAMMLRSLLHLSDQMAIKLDRLEEDVDLKLVETYLKLQNQILNVYKNPDTNRMLFAERSA